jgi:hypothetical protein
MITFIRTFTLLTSLLLTTAQNPTWINSLKGPFTPISLNASDGSISAAFIPHGATLTELWVADKDGVKRDITLGYDNRTLYADDPGHPNFGPIVSSRNYNTRLGSRTVIRYAADHSPRYRSEDTLIGSRTILIPTRRRTRRTSARPTRIKGSIREFRCITTQV